MPKNLYVLFAQRDPKSLWTTRIGKVHCIYGWQVTDSISIILKHNKGLAEQFKAEKRMLLFLYNSFGVHFYLFEKGEIPLETPQIPFCLPVNWLLVFTQRGGHVMLLLMEKWHKFKLLSSWWPFPTQKCCSPTDTLKVCRWKCSAESVCIHIQPVLTAYYSMTIH